MFRNREHGIHPTTPSIAESNLKVLLGMPEALSVILAYLDSELTRIDTAYTEMSRKAIFNSALRDNAVLLKGEFCGIQTIHKCLSKLISG